MGSMNCIYIWEVRSVWEVWTIYIYIWEVSSVWEVWTVYIFGKYNLYGKYGLYVYLGSMICMGSMRVMTGQQKIGRKCREWNCSFIVYIYEKIDELTDS